MSEYIERYQITVNSEKSEIKNLSDIQQIIHIYNIHSTL